MAKQIQFKNPRQVILYLETIFQGLRAAHALHSAAYEEREEHERVGLERLAEMKMAEMIQDLNEKKLRLVKGAKKQESEEEVTQFMEDLFTAVFGVRFEEMSREIGERYGYILELERTAKEKSEYVERQIKENMHNWAKKDPQGMLELGKYLFDTPGEEDFDVLGDAQETWLSAKQMIAIEQKFIESEWRRELETYIDDALPQLKDAKEAFEMEMEKSKAPPFKGKKPK